MTRGSGAADRLAVRGCRDVFPVVAAMRRALVLRFAEIARCYGFAEVEIPILERSDLFSGTLGPTSDVVSSELFRVIGPELQDSGGNTRDKSSVVLRPEGTAGAARAFAPRVPGDSSRIWYTGPMFRYERPQKFRFRQFTQIGAECFGDSSIMADVDCITLAHEFLTCSNVGRLAKLEINTLGTREDRQQYNAELSVWLKPKYAALSEISRARFDSGNCMRILDSKLSEDEDAVRGAPMLLERVCESERRRFKLLQSVLNDLEVPFTINPSLVRGLDYYSSSAFEFIEPSGRAVCAGGRYDAVQGASGVGFAAGLERLEGDMNSDNDVNCNVLGGVRGGVAVIAMGSTSAGGPEDAMARFLVKQLRQSGVCALLKLVPQKLGKAIGKVVKEGALAVIVVGPEEARQGVVQLKLFGGSTHESRLPQHLFKVEDVAEAVTQHLGGLSS